MGTILSNENTGYRRSRFHRLSSGGSFAASGPEGEDPGRSKHGEGGKPGGSHRGPDSVPGRPGGENPADPPGRKSGISEGRHLR